MKSLNFPLSFFSKRLRYAFKDLRTLGNPPSTYILFDFGSQKRDHQLWDIITDQEVFGGDSSASKHLVPQEAALCVKGELKKNPDFNLQIEHMFAGIRTGCLVKRNLYHYNGVRLTLRSNSILKLRLFVQQGFSSNVIYEGLWCDHSNRYESYELPFLNFSQNTGNNPMHFGVTDIQPDLSLSEMEILAEQTHDSTFEFSLKRVELVNRQEFEDLRDNGYKLPVMVKYAESYKNEVDNFRERIKFAAGEKAVEPNAEKKENLWKKRTKSMKELVEESRR